MLRVSEIYLSVQGEGPRAGMPTVFVRFAGCNLRCAGWPCDTPHAIFPELYRKEWRSIRVIDVVNEIKVVAGDRKVNICFTGGEPFLQKHEDLAALVDTLSDHPEIHALTFECFSNGTLQYPDWALEQLCFIMDWKLVGSQEDPYNAMRFRNLALLRSADAVKFVIKDWNDFNQAVALYDEFIVEGKSRVEVYYGAVWGAVSNEELIGWVLDAKLPWRLNVQVHNYIWDRKKRGI